MFFERFLLLDQNLTRGAAFLFCVIWRVLWSALECSGVRLMIEMSGLESYNEVKNYVQAY